MMKKIVAKDKEHLFKIIEKEIELNGEKCNLNYIDVSKITDMSHLFEYCIFNGDISEWDTSNVENMYGMFSRSLFNGDISLWNVSKVQHMKDMFSGAEFQGDINNWKPYELNHVSDIFKDCSASIPYWANYQDKKIRNNAIKNYHLKNELDSDLTKNNIQLKKNKI